MSGSQGEFDLAAAGARDPTSSPATVVEPKYSIPRMSPFAKGLPSSCQETPFQGHVPQRTEAMDATMLAAQERMEDDEMIVHPDLWPRPSDSDLERIAAFKKDCNSHTSFWRKTDRGGLYLYSPNGGTPFVFKT